MKNRHTLALGLITLTFSLLTPSYIAHLLNSLQESGMIIFLGNHLQNAEAKFVITVLVAFLFVSLLATLKLLGSFCISCYFKNSHFQHAKKPKRTYQTSY
ncbi:MAG: hypothetical protein KAH22_09315 [Thiotrichaceae bacterium]|nr:hypothetical protein [Thiotrichaceae bacterium]